LYHAVFQRDGRQVKRSLKTAKPANVVPMAARGVEDGWLFSSLGGNRLAPQIALLVP